jgi:hypothetical protein
MLPPAAVQFYLGMVREHRRAVKATEMAGRPEKTAMRSPISATITADAAGG